MNKIETIKEIKKKKRKQCFLLQFKRMRFIFLPMKFLVMKLLIVIDIF